MGGPGGRAEGVWLTWKIWGLTLNRAENALSFASMLFTIGDDVFNNGGAGENTVTSVATFLVGGASPDPLADLIIDGYASGYNHGIFNGIRPMFSSGELFKK